MGCSAAKNLTVEPLDGNKVTELSNGNAETRKISIPRSVSDVPPLEGEDPQTEILAETATVNNIQKGANGLSFEIAFQDEGEESIIRKHPPKRFQRLEEQQTSPTTTLVKLQEKLDEAEIRRQQILQQRVQSAKFRNILKKQSSVSSLDEEPGLLKVPPDIPHPANPYDVSYI
ncbi:uncharacterized protein LOC103315035 [Tribolium castaneum]|uniref:Uncharacterized protein n=1 Tax=Tribolium castaneum TaxID=7070 RepID=D6WCK5_TRICA|nr:PREDICTED: uncharacterized protein LOC103315035 [Tribolium castaneum]EEZ99041.1 hypothetical protein TcasGA2_TC004915 [Tribolium castaneum]|eukprot:XP_008200901.1 PREDICTED: uncharacterized protein LOC103315035 [Tribolium castaneum]